MKKKAPRTKDQGELLLSWHWERQLAWPGWLLAMFRQSLAFPRHLWTIFSQWNIQVQSRDELCQSPSPQAAAFSTTCQNISPEHLVTCTGSTFCSHSCFSIAPKVLASLSHVHIHWPRSPQGSAVKVYSHSRWPECIPAPALVSKSHFQSSWSLHQGVPWPGMC